MLPNLITIGAMKSGTSSLHRYLGLHPDVAMSTPKELSFFTEATFARGVDWYCSHFASDAAVRGESSPSYTKQLHVHGVPERMASVVPDVKLLYLVRDPIERIVSHHVHSIAAGRTRRTLEEACAGPEGEVYLDTSRYHLQLTRYLDHFPAEQILVVATEDLSERRTAVLTEVLAFVGLSAEGFPFAETEVIHHASDRKRQRSVLRRSAGPVVRRLDGWPLVGPVAQRARTVARASGGRPLERPVLTPALREHLEDQLGDDVARLRAFTGQSLARWSL